MFFSHFLQQRTCTHTHAHTHTYTYIHRKVKIGKFPEQLGKGERHCGVIETTWTWYLLWVVLLTVGIWNKLLTASGSLLSCLYIKTTFEVYFYISY